MPVTAPAWGVRRFSRRPSGEEKGIASSSGACETPDLRARIEPSATKAAVLRFELVDEAQWSS